MSPEYLTMTTEINSKGAECEAGAEWQSVRMKMNKILVNKTLVQVAKHKLSCKFIPPSRFRCNERYPCEEFGAGPWPAYQTGIEQ